MFKLHNYNIILPKYLEIVKKKGSTFVFSAHGWWGKEKNPSAEKSVCRKVLGAKPKQAGKKEGGWGEFRFSFAKSK